jgi:outer membrane protein assembly factor BamB
MLKAFTHDGQERWSVDWGRLVTQHGFGTSPVVVGDKVLLFASQDAEELPAGVEPGEDRMIAYDKQTGNMIWERPLKTTRVCYGVPCIASNESKSVLFSASTGEGFFAIDIADGKQLWSVPMFQKRICSSPILAGSRLIATEGSGGGGNVLSAVGWKSAESQSVLAEPPTLQYQIQRAASYVPTPVVDGDFLFTWADNGVVSCFDLNTGKNQWSQRVGGNFSGSPVILAGKLVNVSADGVLSIVKASSTYSLVGSVDLEQSVRSTIAAVSDRMLIRTEESLWIIGK